MNSNSNAEAVNETRTFETNGSSVVGEPDQHTPQYRASDEQKESSEAPKIWGLPIWLWIIIVIVAIFLLTRLLKGTNKSLKTITDSVDHTVDRFTAAMDDVPDDNDIPLKALDAAVASTSEYYSYVKDVSENSITFGVFDPEVEGSKMGAIGAEIAEAIKSIPGYSSFIPIYEAPSIIDAKRRLSDDEFNVVKDFFKDGKLSYLTAYAQFSEALTALELQHAPSEVSADDIAALASCASYTAFPVVDTSHTTTTRTQDFSRKTQVAGCLFCNNKRVQTTTTSDTTNIKTSYDLKCTAENQVSAANMTALWETQFLNNAAFFKMMGEHVAATAPALDTAVHYMISCSRSPKSIE